MLMNENKLKKKNKKLFKKRIYNEELINIKQVISTRLNN